MHDLISYLSDNPVALAIFAVAVILIAYFVLRNVLRFIVIGGLVLVVLGIIVLYGYYHYSGEPDKFPQSVRGVVDSIGDQKERVIEAGKDVVEKVGESIKESRIAPEEE